MNARQQALAQRLLLVRQRMEAACARAGRPVESVTLVAVTKTVEPEVAADLLALGVSDFGENRPQELWRKAAAVPAGRWHLIGHLQRNKVDKTLPLAALIHSVDSQRLLDAIEAEALRQERTVGVLLEVNCSGEDAKQGFEPDQVLALADKLRGLKQVRVRGLMTMAALTDDPEHARPAFRRLGGVAVSLRSALAGTPHTVDQLSMGMSGDFEVAIEEGATLIRVGSTLVGDLPNP
ncbi:MAG: YggS family pyridoxal phosphate-dependent enzyme [Gemmataceae bacterium]